MTPKSIRNIAIHKTYQDAVLLDGRQNVESARKKIERSKLDWVAIRRTEGLIVFWYTFEVGFVLGRITGKDDQMSIKQALELHESQASPVHDLSDPISLASENPDTVVINNGEFIGIRLAGLRPPLSITEFYLTSKNNLQSIRPTDKDVFKRFLPLKSFMAPKFTHPDSPEVVPTFDPHQFKAYPKLEVPSRLSPRESFIVVIGLASKPQVKTVGGQINIALPSVIDKFSLDLMVVADGFDMPQGCRFKLPVDRAHLDAQTVSITLIAPTVFEDALLTTISVIYFFNDVPCGTASKKVAVIPKGQEPLSNPYNSGVLWTDNPPTSGTVNIPQGLDSIDLTVTISKPDGNPTSGQFLWNFHSPHPVSLPNVPVAKNLGTDAKEFAVSLIGQVQNCESQGQSLINLEIGGLGNNIAEIMPQEFWLLLRGVSDSVHKANPNRTPTVLFLTAETNVPWELALLSDPIYPNTPRYLGCQVSLARWPLNDSGNPPLPPKSSIEVKQIAVVIGDYATKSGWRNLDEAKKEGDAIVDQFNGIKLEATAEEISQLLYAKLQINGKETGVEVVHFACHGEAISTHTLDAAIILDNGSRMSPTWLTTAPLGKGYAPFLFLNACQVGKAGELLGSFSGFAGESLKGGFRGFLAPLWSVNDGIACDIAREFYDSVFGANGNSPQTVASVLRDLRIKFAPGPGRDSATSYAYVFYGHPCLTLHKK